MMKIVFVSNYFNHHQKPFCDKMYRRFGADFTFISTAIMREERKKLGYSQDNHPSYVFNAYENKNKQKEAVQLITDADVVIAGSTPNKVLVDRIQSGKILLRYSERPFKRKITFVKRVYYTFKFRINDLFGKKNYMLCAGAYVASDYASVGMYRNRVYKWGYFPECRKYDIDGLLSKKKTNTILWCGRFIDWKHPDDAIKVAYSLKKEGYSFHLNMIGAGDMEDELKLLVKELDLGNAVHFLGSMPPDQVRSHMEEAGIYLFTSDRQEGWGAVLNEAMNSGCAIVASHSIGSVPYLLKHCENGMVYESGNLNMLFEKVTDLLCHPEKQRRLGFSAYHTIIDEWNADIAASRLIELIKSLMAGENSTELFASGPCSFAENISDDYV